MLQRSSSDAAIRLRRAKSISSVHSRRTTQSSETQDPEVAQRNAHLAALHAYENAYGHSTTMICSRSMQSTRKGFQTPRKAEGSHFVERRESGARLRTSTLSDKPSSRPRPVRKEQHIFTIDGSVHSPKDDAVTESFMPASHVFTSSAGNAEAVNFSRNRSMRKARSSQDFSMTSDKASATQKQRMLEEFVLSQRDVTYDDPDPTHTLRSIAEYDNPAGHHRTFSSFLGQHKLLHQDPDDEGHPDKKIVRKRTSFISNPLGSRRGRAHTHSAVQTTTTTITRKKASEGGDQEVTEVLTASHMPQHDSSDVVKARTPSLSLKGILKRVFRKASQPQPSELLPQQQVEASKAHFCDQWDSAPTFHAKATNAQDTAEAVLTRARSRTPSTSAPKNNPEGSAVERLRQTSGRSDASAAQSRSRVTSWADSTHSGTAGSRSTQKRLSVIDELYIQQPTTPSGHECSSAVPTTTLGSRIYSRIMKKPSVISPAVDSSVRLNTPTEDPETLSQQRESQRKGSGPSLSSSTLTALPSQQQRISSFAAKAKVATMSTIRAVTPDGRRSSSRKGGGVLLDRHDFDNEDTLIQMLPGGFPSPIEDSMRIPIDTVRPSSDLIAERARKSRDRWQSSLETQAALYPPRPLVNDARDLSTVLTDVSKQRRATTDETIGNILHGQNVSLPNPHSPNHESFRGDMTGAISPSVYSRATDESPEKPIQSQSSRQARTFTPRPRERTDTDGTAVVLSSFRISPSKSPKKSQQKPAYELRDSRDWRAWLTQELADFDLDSGASALDEDNGTHSVGWTGSATPASNNQSGLGSDAIASPVPPEMPLRIGGHHRENAQIRSSEDEESTNEPEALVPVPLTNLQPLTSRSSIDPYDYESLRLFSGNSAGTVPVNTATLARQQLNYMNDRFPMLSISRSSKTVAGTSSSRPRSAASDDRTSSQVSRHRAPSDASSHVQFSSTPRLTSLAKENAPFQERSQPSGITSRLTSNQMKASSPQDLLRGDSKRTKSMIPLKIVSPLVPMQTNSIASLPQASRKGSISPRTHDENNVLAQTTMGAAYFQSPSISLSAPGDPNSPNKGFMRQTSSLRFEPTKRLATPHATLVTLTAESSPRRARSNKDLQPPSDDPTVIRPNSAQSIRRKPLNSAQAKAFEGATMQRIVDGPYGRTDSPAFAMGASKENTTPSPVRSLRLRGSLNGMNGSGSGGGGSSPSGGQRMADDFLKRRMGGLQYGATSGRPPAGEARSETGSPLTPGFI